MFAGVFCFLFFVSVSSYANPLDTADGIEWLDIRNIDKGKSKLIFVDMYTDWCGWCRKMDATTFSNRGVVRYLNTNFERYRFNAELNDNIFYNNKLFVFDINRGFNMLALYLTNGNVSLPATVIINPKNNDIYPFFGYRSVVEMEFILKYFNETQDLTGDSYESFRSKFKPEW